MINKTFGGVGADFTDMQACLDFLELTSCADDYTFTQTGDCTMSATPVDENIVYANGHTILFTTNNPHGGDTNNGYSISFPLGSQVNILMWTSGKIVFDGLKCISTSAVAGQGIIFFNNIRVQTSFCYQDFRNMIFLGNNNDNEIGIVLPDGSAHYSIVDCKFYNCYRGMYQTPFGGSATTDPAYLKIYHNSVYSGTYGVYIRVDNPVNGIDIKNNVVAGQSGTTPYAYSFPVTGSYISISYCADDDGSQPSYAINKQENITPADEFISTTYTSSDFLKPKRTGVIANGGIAVSSTETSLVNIMTNNNTPSPLVASASTGADAHNAFDGVNVTYLDSWWSTAPTGWLKIDLGAGNEKIFANYYINAMNHALGPTTAPKDWTLQGSNNDIDWDIVDTVTNQIGWSVAENRLFACDVQATAYRYYKIDITANNGHANIAIGEMILRVMSVVSLDIAGAPIPDYAGWYPIGAHVAYDEPESASESSSESSSESVSESSSESLSESSSESFSESVSESLSESISQSFSESISESMSESTSESSSESSSESASESSSESASQSTSESASESKSESASESLSESASPSPPPEFNRINVEIKNAMIYCKSANIDFSSPDTDITLVGMGMTFKTPGTFRTYSDPSDNVSSLSDSVIKASQLLDV